MRKLLIAINVSLLVINLGCNTYSTGPIQGSTDKCGRQICKNYSNIPLFGVVDGNTLQKMSSAYAADPGKGFITPATATNPESQEQDALSVCFTLDQLKNFISKMEDAACSAGCDSNTELAIRFYMIKYPGDLGPGSSAPLCLQDLPAICSNKHSLAMVPAFKRGDEFHDFSLTNFNKDCFKLPMKTIDLGSIKNAAILPTAGAGNGDNHGGLAPPPGLGIYPTN